MNQNLNESKKRASRLVDNLKTFNNQVKQAAFSTTGGESPTWAQALNDFDSSESFQKYIQTLLSHDDSLLSKRRIFAYLAAGGGMIAGIATGGIPIILAGIGLAGYQALDDKKSKEKRTDFEKKIITDFEKKKRQLKMMLQEQHEIVETTAHLDQDQELNKNLDDIKEQITTLKELASKKNTYSKKFSPKNNLIEVTEQKINNFPKTSRKTERTAPTQTDQTIAKKRVSRDTRNTDQSRGL